MAIFGHADLLESLHSYLPPVSLFIGPYSVGKWAVAEHLRWYYDIADSDVYRTHLLDVETAQTIREYSLTPPSDSQFKLVIADLYKSRRQAQDSLMGRLDHEGDTRFILIGQASDFLPGIITRGVSYRFSRLSSADVANVLIEKKNIPAIKAKDLAARSGGQVYEAIRLDELDDTLEVVREVLSSIILKDEEALMALAPKWTDSATALLIQWCNEAISQRWRVFTPKDRVSSISLPLRILILLKSKVRPKLVVRAQLRSLIRGE